MVILAALLTTIALGAPRNDVTLDGVGLLMSPRQVRAAVGKPARVVRTGAVDGNERHDIWYLRQATRVEFTESHVGETVVAFVHGGSTLVPVGIACAWSTYTTDALRGSSSGRCS